MEDYEVGGAYIKISLFTHSVTMTAFASYLVFLMMTCTCI